MDYKQLLREVKNNEREIRVTYSERVVYIKQGDEVLKTIDNFNPFKHYHKGLRGGAFKWEQGLCSLVDLDFYNIISRIPSVKHRMKYYTYYLRCAPTRWIRIYNACMCKAFIPQDLYNFAYTKCKGNRGHYDKIAVENINLHKEVILQCLDDGIENITPFFTFLSNFWGKKEEASVAALKKKVGKGLWKQLTKNSFSRNKLICLSHDVKTVALPRYYSKEDFSLKTLQQIPSGLLSNSRSKLVDQLDTALLIKQQRLITKKQTHQEIRNLVYDTKSMCDKLGETLPCCKKWDLDKWVQKHECYQKQLQLLRYSKEPFEVLKNTPEIHRSSCDNFYSVLLDNAYDIAQEGKHMKHCVATYCSEVKEGTYIVLSIRNTKGERQSTLGLRVVNNTVQLHQHYKEYNKTVVDANEVKFRTEIVNTLNKLNLKTKGE